MSQEEKLDKFKSIENLSNTVLDEGSIDLINVKGGLQGFIAVSLYQQAKEKNKGVLFVLPTEAIARRKFYTLSKYVDNIIFLPEEHIHTFFSDAFSIVSLKERQEALIKTVEDQPALMVTSINALLKKLPSPAEFLHRDETIKVGEEVDFDDLIKRLEEYGYEREYQTEAPGQFSIRGEILDVFLINESMPVRIDFFDNEIETIKYFDAATQRSEESVDQIVLAPMSENWLSEEERTKALDYIRKNYQDERFQDKIDELLANNLTTNGILFSFVENKTSYFDYITYESHEKPIVILANPKEAQHEVQDYLARAASDFEAESLAGESFPEEINRFFTEKQIFDQINSYPHVDLYDFTNLNKPVKTIDMDSKTIQSFAGQPALLRDYLDQKLDKGYKIHFFARNEQGLTKLKNYINIIGDTDKIRLFDDSDFEFSVGEISEGFELEQDKLIYLNETDFFKAPKQKRHKRDENSKPIDRFTDLKEEDYVVHDDYGIGKYKGVERLDYGDGLKDMIKIEYAGGDYLYFPVEQMDLIQVYVGAGETAEPKLSQMDTHKWTRMKEKAKKDAQEIARDLIEIYSKRENLDGYAYQSDSPEQYDFEEAFPFIETDDQLRSIEEIKRDMESTKMMDRLLCGDVGYGKTEVAFRAAFKAAMEGKQTIMLVPTSVLAQQHYLTAKERFKDFPVNVALLSRFNTAKEIRETKEGVADGSIDILIGTHRILNPSIKYHDVGLLIVDEEQRFGVRTKEKFKKYKEEVDVLTLSATPIPRTLHMSLSGVRDMSVLEEPPSGRRPVQTYVLKYSEPVIKDAIERELARNGQVYFIHNNIDDIQKVVDRLQTLVPHARIAYAHGRMNSKELEDVMYHFLNGEYDILVSTTIVENGLDVQNANTIIVDEGDHFGLAQLYQLRGRVGRSDRQAFAYITHNKKKLTENAEKRLKAIRDFTAFGSGFKVAMRDLEIRGAGDLLGKRQSGHMTEIGYELYTRILNEAIHELTTGQKPKERFETTISIPVEAYIPERYIQGDNIRYEIYRKIAHLSSWSLYDDLEAELEDRFGSIPVPVYNLMMVAMIKNIASDLGITSISYNKETKSLKIVFFKKSFEQAAQKALDNLKEYREKIQINKTKLNQPCWYYYNDNVDFELLTNVYELFLDIYEESTQPKGEIL